MVMRRGDVFWADLGEAMGSEPGYLRPVLVVQADAYTASRLATTIVLSLTGNTELRKAPGCVLLTRRESGLPEDSVANATQLRTIDKGRLGTHVGQLDDATRLLIARAPQQVLAL
jgi:mRNA interferase MazF